MLKFIIVMVTVLNAHFKIKITSILVHMEPHDHNIYNFDIFIFSLS